MPEPARDLTSPDAAELSGWLLVVAAVHARGRPHGHRIAKLLEKAATDLELAAGLIALREAEEARAKPGIAATPTNRYNVAAPSGNGHGGPVEVRVNLGDDAAYSAPSIEEAKTDTAPPPPVRRKPGRPPKHAPRAPQSGFLPSSEDLSPAERGAIALVEWKDVKRALAAGAKTATEVADRLQREGVGCTVVQAARLMRIAGRAE